MKYSDLVEGLDAIVWEGEPDTLAFTFVSQRAETMLGYPVERWLDEPDFWIKLIHPADRAQTVEFCRQATAQGNDHTHEYRVVAADGRVVWLHDAVRVICDAQGQVRRLCGVMIDITGKKQAENWRRHYTDILEQITNAAPLSAILRDLCVFAEQQNEGTLCSICLLSPDGKYLQHAAAPSLPDFYNHAMDGLEVGENTGACGTAAYTGQTVLIEDMLTHPDCAGFRDLARRAELRACWSEPILASDGKVLGTFAVYHRESRLPGEQEISDIRHAARLAAVAIERTRHQEASRLTEAVFEQSPEGIMVTDASERIVAVNRAFTEVTGYTAEELIGQTPSILESGRHDKAFFHELKRCLAERGHWGGEIWNRRKSGEIFPSWMAISAVRDADGLATRFISILADISAHKSHEEQIKKLAYYDPLTELPNRTLFMDRLQLALADAKRHHRSLALVMLDLIRFKEINEIQGHKTGDKILVAVAQRLRRILREGETLARFGADEFCVIALNADQSAAVFLAERLQQAFVEPVEIGRHSFTLEISMGIALYPQDGGSSNKLIQHATIALSRIKPAAGYRFYRHEMGEDLARRIGILKRLQKSFGTEQFKLYYQPIVDLSTGKLLGAEALLRWHEPEWGWVSPAEFIPLAEQRRMMDKIGAWVVKAVGSQITAWRESGLVFAGRVSINISAQQMVEAKFAEEIEASVRSMGLTPGVFDLELTESSIMSAPERVIDAMGALKAAGFSIAIDDFGTGYSSLTYLKRFPVDELKIDQSFVKDMLDERNDRAIVTVIIAMAHSLGLKTIAEGVETKAQAEDLVILGCDSAQGYYFGHPVPAEDFARTWLTTSSG